MKKIFLLSLFALSGVFVLASCGDDTKTDDDTGKSSADDSGKDKDDGGTTVSDGVKVYAAPNDTFPVYLMTYTKDSKLNSFVYMNGSAPIYGQVVYKNNVPDEVKVCSFDSFFGVNTTKAKLDGTTPIYYTNISDNIFYMVPAYSYAEYKDNAINVKTAGVDAYKIKLTGEVESTYFKQITKDGLKVGFYDNKFENDKVVATNYEGKAEMTFDGTKFVTQNYLSRGNKYANYGKTTFEVKDTYAEYKITKPSPFYSEPIDYSSARATIDSNFVTTAVSSKTYVKYVSMAENTLSLETPIQNDRTCTVPETNKYKMSYTDDGYDTEAELTYENGKVKEYTISGVDYATVTYDYKNNNEVEVNLVGQDSNQKRKLEFKYNVMGQILSNKQYDATDTLIQTSETEYTDKFATAKQTTIAGDSKMETVYTYDDAFTSQTAVRTSYINDVVQTKSKNVSTVTTTARTYETYTIKNDTEIKTQTRSQRYDENGVGISTYTYYNADGSVNNVEESKVYYDQNLLLAKDESYRNETLNSITEYTYTGGKLTNIKTTYPQSQEINKEFTFNDNVLTTITKIVEYLNNDNLEKYVYTFSNNYSDMNTENFKWDDATHDFIPANQS